MPRVEVSLPEDLQFRFEQMVEEEFVTQEQAVEELLSAGIEAYNNGPNEADEIRSGFGESAEENLWDTDTRSDDDML